MWRNHDDRATRLDRRSQRSRSLIVDVPIAEKVPLAILITGDLLIRDTTGSTARLAP
jgi:hypothetical protein